MGRNNDCPILKQIAEWAGDSCDFMKPAPIKTAYQKTEKFETLDLSVMKMNLNIVSSLPTEDDDPMTVAFYPSNNNLDEGVVRM